MGRTSDAKERMIAAVLDMIWEGSFGTLRIDEICKRAEVKKGSFYYYFQSKEDLVVEALEYQWENESKPILDKHFSPANKPLERFDAYFANGYEYQKELTEKYGKVPGCPFLSLASEVSFVDERVAKCMRGLLSHKRRYFESAIRDAIAEGALSDRDVSEQASAIWAFIEGSLVQSRILNSLEPIKSLAPRVRALLTAPVAV